MAAELMVAIDGTYETSFSPDHWVAQEDAALVAGAKIGDARAFVDEYGHRESYGEAFRAVPVGLKSLFTRDGSYQRVLVGLPLSACLDSTVDR